MGAPVVHFEILGKNGNKQQDFYSQLFDWEIDANNPINYGIIKAQREGSIGGGIASTQDGSSGHATFYVEVDDLQATLDQAENMGGKTVVPVTHIPKMVTFAMFTDPEGHLVGLVKDETSS